ncbi:MAG: flagellar motor protein MotB [Nitrospiraceae bacterium]|nr:flagellar motor protein MotB [Nitrospiraceae bacterium]
MRDSTVQERPCRQGDVPCGNAGAGRSGQGRFRSLAERSRSSVDSDSNWLITLSDMFSLLLVVFVMFFVMARNTGRPAAPKAGAVPPVPLTAVAAPLSLPVTDLRNEVAAELRRLDMGDGVEVSETGKEIVVSLKEKVTFNPGDAAILKGTEPVLDNIAGVIQRHPELMVDIEGYTDNIPINTAHYPSNWELSVARATSVLKYFISRHQVDSSRLSVRGNADHAPRASNDTPEERAMNRRVEIRLRDRAA